MLVDSQLYSFILITIILTISPGVDTMIVIKNVILKDRKAGVLAALGICSGLLVHALLSALGLSLILTQSEFLYNMVKIIGALYLIWIGVNTLKDINNNTLAVEKNNLKPSRSKLFSNPFQEGLLSNLFNPKAVMFFLAFFPQFINPSDPIILKTLFLASIKFVIGLVWLVTLAIFIFKIKDFMLKPLVNKIFKSFTGSIFILFGVKLILEDSK